jgi:Na+/H+ antiporter NhaA
MDVRGWINNGLMRFFFLVVGLEAHREFDIGEFRERPGIILPVLAGLGGMAGDGGALPGDKRRSDLCARMGRGDVD